MIPTASEFKEEITLRRAIETAAQSAEKPDTAEVQASVLLDQIRRELERERLERRPGRTSVDIPLPVENHNSSLVLVRSFLTSKGYAVTLNSNSLNISWGP